MAETTTSTTATNTCAVRPQISLVLGGGGAKGFVHLGVFKAIEQQQLSIASIIGTSIGAIWGALYANAAAITFSGRTDAPKMAIETIEQLAYQAQVRDYLDLYVTSFFRKGLLKGDKFERWLETMLWYHGPGAGRALTFLDLDFDLTVTTSDAWTGESIICNRTSTPSLSIAKAVRASMSVQGVFKEIQLDLPEPGGKIRTVTCWDGGTTGNCRFDIAYRNNVPQPVIASSLTYRGSPVQIRGGWFRRATKIRDHSINIMLRQMESLIVENLSQPERVLLIHPPLQGLSSAAFSIKNPRKAAAIEAACVHAKREIEVFRKKLGF